MRDPPSPPRDPASPPPQDPALHPPSASAKLSTLGKKFLSKRSKHRDPEHAHHFPLFRRESSRSVDAQQQQDVSDFLSAARPQLPSSSPAAAADRRKPAMLPPKLDTAVAKQTPVASSIGTPTAGVPADYENGRFDPWVPSKPPRRPGLHVGFVLTVPEVIGHGGDDTEDPVASISARMRGLGLSQAPPRQLVVHPQHDLGDPDFVPKPMRRVQTGFADQSPEPSRLHQNIAPVPPIPSLPERPQRIQAPPRLDAPLNENDDIHSSHGLVKDVNPFRESGPARPTMSPPKKERAPSLSLQRNTSLRRMRAAEGMAFRLSGSFEPPDLRQDSAPRPSARSSDSGAESEISPPSSILAGSEGRRPLSTDSIVSDIEREAGSCAPASQTNQDQRPSPSSPLSAEDAPRDFSPPVYPPSHHSNRGPPPPIPNPPAAPPLLQQQQQQQQQQQPPPPLRQIPHPPKRRPDYPPLSAPHIAAPIPPAIPRKHVGPPLQQPPPPPPAEAVEPTQPSSLADDPTTLEGFGALVGHLSPIFQMAATSLPTQPVPTDWARAALWWFLRARAGLEELVKSKARPGEPGFEQYAVMLTSYHTWLAKTRWILLDVLPSYSKSALDHGVVGTMRTLPGAVEGLLRSMAKRNLVPLQPIEVQSGVDTALWLLDPLDPLAPHFPSAIKAAAMFSSHPEHNAFPSLPVNEPPGYYVLHRLFSKAVVQVSGENPTRDPFTVLVTVLRDARALNLLLVVSTQSLNLDVIAALLPAAPRGTPDSAADSPETSTTGHGQQDFLPIPAPPTLQTTAPTPVSTSSQHSADSTEPHVRHLPNATVDTQSASLSIPIPLISAPPLTLRLLPRQQDLAKLLCSVSSLRAVHFATTVRPEDHETVGLATAVPHVQFSSFITTPSQRDLEASWFAEPCTLCLFEIPPTSKHVAGASPRSPGRHYVSSADRPTSAASSRSNLSEYAPDEEKHSRFRSRLNQGRALLGKGLDKLQHARRSRSRSGSGSRSHSGSRSPPRPASNASSASHQSLARRKMLRVSVATLPSFRTANAAELLLLSDLDKQQVAVEPLDGDGFPGVRVRARQDLPAEEGQVRRSRMTEIILGFKDEATRGDVLARLEGWDNVGRWLKAL